LRRRVVDGGHYLAAEPLGLGLVCRVGLVGWMKAWRAVSDVPAIKPVRSTGKPFGSSALVELPGWQRELTVLLAQMTTRHVHPLSA